MRQTQNLSAASLFCGVGGLESGFVRRGVEIVGAWDTSEPARHTYQSNTSVAPSARDVLTLSSSDVKGADIIFAGPPCQGFTALARHDGADPRNHLIIAASKLIAQARPLAFIIENVAGLKWQSNGIFARRAIQLLRDADLECELVEIDCARLGVAQRRRRVLLVGGRQVVGRSVARAVAALSEDRFPPASVRDALLPESSLQGLPNHEPRPFGVPWYGPVIAALRPGQKLCDTRLADSSVHSWDVPEVFGATTEQQRSILVALARLRRREKNRRYEHIGDGRPVTLRQLLAETHLTHRRLIFHLTRLESAGYVLRSGTQYYDLARKFNGRFRRLSLSGPAPAVLREFAHPRNALHPTAPRSLTVRECARLQAFPDTFRFFGTLSEQYQLVANAFPPLVSERLAKVILPCLCAGLQEQVRARQIA